MSNRKSELETGWQCVIHYLSVVFVLKPMYHVLAMLVMMQTKVASPDRKLEATYDDLPEDHPWHLLHLQISFKCLFIHVIGFCCVVGTDQNS